jgi:Domain of unknown function DUF29
MSTRRSSTISDLYDFDEVAWLDAMVALLRRGAVEELDLAHLAEYLSDIALRERREVESQLSALLVHVLKWVHLPDYRSRSWSETIDQQRQELARRVSRGALQSHAESVLPATYAEAFERTLAETGLSAESVPDACPYTLDALLRFDIADE